MKFKKDGKVYKNIMFLINDLCNDTGGCDYCPLYRFVKNKDIQCIKYCDENVEKAAKLFGFEVIEEEDDKMELPIDIGSMALAQAKEYCASHKNKSCSRCVLGNAGICNSLPQSWSLNRLSLTPEELEICRVLGAKWVTSDTKTGIVELWKEKPTKNPSNGAYYGTNGIRRVACINSQIMSSVKPGDCISVEDLFW